MLIRNYLNTPLRDEVVHEGEGFCKHCTVFYDKEIDAPIRFINYTIIPPNASFGLHKHGLDNEFYVVLSGEGIYYQNDEEQPVRKGDIMMNALNGTHGLRNTGSEEMELLVFECAMER